MYKNLYKICMSYIKYDLGFHPFRFFNLFIQSGQVWTDNTNFQYIHIEINLRKNNADRKNTFFKMERKEKIFPRFNLFKKKKFVVALAQVRLLLVEPILGNVAPGPEP